MSAPIWDYKTSTFAGLLTTSDYINVIQYYWQNPEALNRMDQFRLSALPGMSSNLAKSLNGADMIRNRESDWRLANGNDLNTSFEAPVRGLSADAGLPCSPHSTVGH